MRPAFSLKPCAHATSALLFLSMRLSFAGKTDVGKQRDHNEDAILVSEAHRLILVADGLGGHHSGQVASGLCVSTIVDFLSISRDPDATWPFPYNLQLTDEENYLFTGLRLANKRIFDRAARLAEDAGMGTTCVGAMFSRDARHVSIANVGDSRCYRVRSDAIRQLTRDHSLVSDALESAPWMTPDQVAQLPPNVITRALGIREEVVVDLHNEATEVGDVYLVCSDGLSGLVAPDEILGIVSAKEGLDAMTDELIRMANFYGGPDNVSAVLAKVEEQGPPSIPRPKPSNTGETDFETDTTDPGKVV
jgi:serine/threonine protein phosphatase PrpC